MIVFPAIDIKDNNFVRLEQGEKDRETIYGDDPLKQAKLWKDGGAQYLHIVDLDGAFDGKRKNADIIKKIVENIDIKIQLGGGIRSMEDIKELLDLGVDRVILGTAVIEKKGFIEEALEKYGERIVVSIDARDEYVALKGWTEITDIYAPEFIKALEKKGLKTLVYTDIEKDGMLMGPNFDELEKISKSVDMDIIASGGISRVEDIERLKKMKIYGAIVGKALYDGKLDLEEILE